MESPHGFFFIEAVTLNAEVFVISGDNNKSAGSMEKYNYLSDTWSECAAMPCKVIN